MYLLGVLVLFVSYLIYAAYTINFPQADDFNILLLFLNRFIEGGSISEKLRLLFEMHDVHFHVFSRLCLLLTYHLTGHANFRLTILVGNLALFILPPLLLKAFTGKANVANRLWLPMALILSMPAYAEVCQWSITSWQYLWLEVFVLLALIAERQRRASLEILFALAAVFAAANGSLVGFALGAAHAGRGERKQAAAWLGISSMLAVSLSAAARTQGIAESRQAPSLWKFISYSLQMAGSALGFGSGTASLCFGALLIGLAILLGIRAWRTGSFTQAAFILFLLLSIAANAWGRANVKGEVAYTVSRYSLYSVLLIGSIVTGWITAGPINSERRRAALLSIPLALVVGLSWYREADWIRFRYDLVRTSAVEWAAGQAGLFYYVPEEAAGIMKRAGSLGAFEPPPIDLPLSAALAPLPAVAKGPVFRATEHAIDGEHYLSLSGWAFTQGAGGAPEHMRMAIISADTRREFSVRRMVRPDVVRHHRRFSRKDTRRSGFLAVIDKTLLPASEYEARIVIVRPDGKALEAGLVRPHRPREGG